MVLDERVIGEVIVLKLTGPLDVKGGPEMLGQIGQTLVKGPLNMVLDMAGVRYTDSTGLGSLLRAVRVTAAADGQMRLAAMQPEIFNVFKLAGIDRLFEIYDTVEQAVASYDEA